MKFSPARVYTLLTARLRRPAADRRGGLSVEAALVVGVLAAGLVPGVFAARNFVPADRVAVPSPNPPAVVPT